MLNIKMIHCKPPNISPPEYKRPLCKPTTCSNAHLIPNISPPPNISPLNISPLVYHYCLSLLPLLITIITNTKDRPCTITNILAGRWVRDWTHRFSNLPSEARWVRETSSHPRCVQSRTHRTCKYVWFLSHAISVKSWKVLKNFIRILLFSIEFRVWITNILAANIQRKQTNLGLN
jgi:hypothetical protein